MSVAPVPLSDLLTGPVHHGHHPLAGDTQPSDDMDSVDTETIMSYGDRLSGASEARALLGGDLLRYDTLSDIQRGLNTIGNIIQIVTSVLSLFGASNVDRWVRVKVKVVCIYTMHKIVAFVPYLLLKCSHMLQSAQKVSSLQHSLQST